MFVFIGALNYLLKDWIVKIKFILSGGKKVEVNKEAIPFVIFSDDKRYWSVFEPICREFDRRGVDVVYMTASADDPVLSNEYEHIKMANNILPVPGSIYNLIFLLLYLSFPFLLYNV